ncbi:MAG: tyrosine-type recombinase/integrase [Chitinophagales bacterium]|nr:tyrosine-type recombinase/integrase [Bacteroidota bacterium]
MGEKIYCTAYQEAAKTYRNYLSIIGLNTQTVQMRYLWLKAFYVWLESVQVYEIQLITKNEIAAYKIYLSQKISARTGKPLQAKSVYEQLRNLQQYFGYLVAEGRLKSNPASAIKLRYPAQKTVRFIFSETQIRELYEAANLTEKAIMHVGYGCGLRVQEMSDLNRADVHYEEKILIVESGKNSQRRLIPLSEKMVKILAKYAAKNSENQEKNAAFFINEKGNRMREWSFNSRLKSLVLKTEFGKKLSPESLKKIGIHSLRHSIATHLLANGMKLMQVQQFLGHRQIESTEIYTHISQKQLRKMR